MSSRVTAFFIEGEVHVFMATEGYGAVVGESGVTLGSFFTKWLDSSSQPAASTPAPSTVSPQSAAAPAATSATVLMGCVVALGITLAFA